MDAFFGEIRIFPYNFTPKGWLPCEGQTLSINSYQALFSLLGTTYGGDGQTTFKLPDLRCRVAASVDNSGTLEYLYLGQYVGAPSHTLLNSELPGHNHGNAFRVSSAPGNTRSPEGAIPSRESAGQTNLYGPVENTVPNAALQLPPSGGFQPHTNEMPGLGLNVCIAITGDFPTRD